CSNPSIRRKTFLKLSIPLARISGTRIIGSMASPFFFYLLTPLIFLHSLIFPNNLPSRVYPNSAQKKQLAQDFGCARYVWNHALERRTKAYQEHGERLRGVDISREITSLKRRERPWLGEANSTVLTQVLRDQDHAFQNFFEGRAKYPKFKKKHAAQSVRYQLDQRQVHRTFSACDHRLVLPKLGALKLRWSSEDVGLGELTHQIRCKAHWHGRQPNFVTPPAIFAQFWGIEGRLRIVSYRFFRNCPHASAKDR